MPSSQLIKAGFSAFLALFWLTSAWGACENKSQLDQAARAATDVASRLQALEIAVRECPEFNFQYRLALAYQQQDRFDEAFALYERAIQNSDGSLLATASGLGRQAEISLARQQKANAQVFGNAALQLFLLRKERENQPAPEWFNGVLQVLVRQDWINVTAAELAALIKSEQTHSSQSLRGVSVVPSVDLRVQFDTNSASLTGTGHDQISRLAEALRLVNPKGMITFIGHTDHRGTDEFNQRLSEQRASTLAEELKHALPEFAGQFRIEGRGSKNPLLEGDDPVTLGLNRRVELQLEK